MNASEFKLNLAMVVGINDYQNGVLPLGTARQDAEVKADLDQIMEAASIRRMLLALA